MPGNAATAIMDTYIRASFKNIEVPVSKWSIVGGQRFALHEYPKVPGAQIEKMGRRPYLVKMSVPADEGFNTGGDFGASYGDLYPHNVSQLIQLFEDGTTADLLIPGKDAPLRCFCANWSEAFDAHNRSGEGLDLEFHEDTLDSSYGLQLLQSGTMQLQPKFAALKVAAFAAQVDPFTTLRLVGDTVPGTSLLAGIESAINSIVAIGDQVQLYDQFLATQILRLLGSLQALERTPQMLDPRNDVAFQALMELWASVVATSQDLFAKQTPLRRFPVPRLMTIDEASNAIYGDGTHTGDLLGLNALDDPYAIPTGSSLTYYEEAA